jgi:hypothetical protein
VLTRLFRGTTVRLYRVLLALLTCIAFGGCVVPDIVVKPPVEKADRDGKFCPPGQAKKGNC